MFNQNGVIRYYKNIMNLELHETIQAHDARGVSKLQITPNQKFLVSAGNDGTICLLEIKDSESRSSNDIFIYSGEILATRNEVEEIKIKKEALLSALQDIQVQNSHSSSINDTEDKLKLMDEELQLKKKNEAEVIEQALERKNKKLLEYEQQKEQLIKEYENEINDLEHFYNKTVATESRKVERNKLLIKKQEDENSNYIYDLKKFIETTFKEEQERLEQNIISKEEEMKMIIDVV